MPRGISVHAGLNRVDPVHYQGWSGQLRGCEHDARALADLAGREGFETTVLLTQDARAEDLFREIRRAAATLRSGDIFLLTFAGHGSQVPDEGAGDEEPDQLDETWVLYNRMVLDDEVTEVLGEFRPGVRIVIVPDSCHSGSSDRLTVASPRFLPQDLAAAVYAEHRPLYDRIRESARRALGSADPDTLLLAACQDDETAGENTEHGFFTAALLRVWNEGRFTGGYPTFHRRISDVMPAGQNPTIRFDAGLDWVEQRPFTISTTTKGKTMSTTTLSHTDNWEDVFRVLTDMDIEVTVPTPANRPTVRSTDGSSAARGGVAVRAFWWGFHIELDHGTLEQVLNASDTVNALVGVVGGSIPSPAQPWIVLAAQFVDAAIELVRKADEGNGVYISMSWFAPGIFVPTGVPGGRSGARTLGAQLSRGDNLTAGEQLVSPDGSHRLVLDGDGNLVVRAGSTVRWSSGIGESQPLLRPVRAELGDDGRLVLRSEVGLPVWSTGVQGRPGAARLELRDSGNLVIVDGAGAQIWQSAPAVVSSRSPVLTASRSSEVGWGKRVESSVSLFRDGTMVLDSMNRNDNWFGGLRARTMIVVSDDRGRAIWVSRIFQDPTRCSVPDFSCASNGRITHVENMPAAVAEFGVRLDIYHGDEPNYVDLRNALIDFIKALVDVAAALKAAWDQLQKM